MLSQGSKNSHSGFSMLEVLFALVLLGMVLVGIAVLMTRSLLTAAEARYRDIGNGLAQEVIEIYHRERTLTTWTEFTTNGIGIRCVPTAAKTFADFDTTCPDAGVTISGINFQRQADASVDAVTGKLSVTVTVTWDSGRGGGTISDSITTKQDFSNWL